MKIISYEARGGSKTDLHFSKLNLSKINLIVGASATGKTKLLNAIFNCAVTAVQPGVFYIGWWDFLFEHRKQIYEWKLETGGGEGTESKVLNESIVLKSEGSVDKILVQRDLTSFVYNGNELPQLPSNQSSIFLLKNEALIKPLHVGFSSIMRRSFHGSELEQVSSYQAVPKGLIQKFKHGKNFDDLFSSGDMLLNVRLYILSQYFKSIFERISNEFKSIFPFILEVEVRSAAEFGFDFPGIVPVFAMKEKFIKDKWIPLNVFSSGMQKVLLILTDVFTLPKDGGIYLIDEYENSLGINAINFFPNVFLEAESDSQFIITSHHPYIIGNVPVRDWKILHRNGSNILVKEGRELEEKFGKSKQAAFVQLINDPFYTEGVE